VNKASCASYGRTCLRLRQTLNYSENNEILGGGVFSCTLSMSFSWKVCRVEYSKPHWFVIICGTWCHQRTSQQNFFF